MILTSINNLKAQDSDSLLYYQGQVLSKTGRYPIAFAHIINYTQKWGVTADTTGHFEIWGYAGDTLNISAIGFHYNDKAVLDSSNNLTTIIELQNRAYEIPEASISYLGTYQQFERKVINLELPEIEFNPQVKGLFKYVEPQPFGAPPTLISPISLAYRMFSKEGKEIRKYQTLKDEQPNKDEIWSKYNEYVVRNLTGINTSLIKEFMDYCNFRDEFIQSTSSYILYSLILERYEAFKEIKKDSLIAE